MNNRMDAPTLLANQPGWAGDRSTCNTWLFVNDGNQAIDYARGNTAWTDVGFSFQKNIWVFGDENGADVMLMNKNQRDFLGRQEEQGQLEMVSSDGLNPGSCMDGNNNMVGGCANIVEVRNNGYFKGMWDIESRTNLYTGDNTIQHDYSLYCRRS